MAPGQVENRKGYGTASEAAGEMSLGCLWDSEKTECLWTKSGMGASVDTGEKR
jgi:hypothetical protein